MPLKRVISTVCADRKPRDRLGGGHGGNGETG
jgi:hypothetical protein